VKDENSETGLPLGRTALFGREFIATIFALVLAGAAVGVTLASATLVRAAIEKARGEAAASSSQPRLSLIASYGQKLYAVNCSHCHADDATGDEGPDLRGLTKSDERIKGIITNGIKGEMPAFGKKLHEADKEALVGFLRSRR
jgi:mono/diheme cytochrome c family protein